MAEGDPLATQRGLIADIPAELRGEGFDEVDEIGRGGFGVVYRCAQPMLDRTVAVKVLNSELDADNLERFLREQRAMGRLSGHPNIVTIMQVGTTASGRPYLVMPYYQKDSLEALIRKHGPLDWVETLSVGIKLAGALEAAHRVGTLHRDVKPGNILLSDYGEPQLTDFGIARISGGFQTSTGMIAGSPAFTAPEILEAKRRPQHRTCIRLGQPFSAHSPATLLSNAGAGRKWWPSSCGSPRSQSRTCANRDFQTMCQRSSSGRWREIRQIDPPVPLNLARSFAGSSATTTSPLTKWPSQSI